MIQKISIATITVGQRHRKEMGDLQALSESIKQIGLLQPIGVTSKMQLVWGERRLKACQMLGWTEIDTVVDPTLDDIVRAMQAEKDENSCRLPFTPSEQVAIADQIESVERRRAEERQKVAQRASAEQTNRILGRTAPAEEKTVGEESAPTVSNSGKTREKVAAAVGMSHGTLTQARKVVADGTPELVEAMDKGTVSVNAAAQIASLPPEEQREVVAGGKEAIANAATKIRTDRKQKTGGNSGGQGQKTKLHENKECYPKLYDVLERLDVIARLRPNEVHLGALREALKDLRKELESVLS